MAGIRDLIVATLHDRLGYRPENAADPGERFAFPHAAEIADALAPVFEAKLSELAGERDRARDVAVALEQELAGYDARVEAGLKQVIRTAGTVDAREQVGFVLAGWQDPDPVDIPPFSAKSYWCVDCNSIVPGQHVEGCAFDPSPPPPRPTAER